MSGGWQFLPRINNWGVRTMSKPKLALKGGVKINGAHFEPTVALILSVAQATAPELTDNTVWVTSANDGKHMSGSKHYENRAFDLRTRNVTGGPPMVAGWRDRMARMLGASYDVVNEGDHLHVEYDPK